MSPVSDGRLAELVEIIRLSAPVSYETDVIAALTELQQRRLRELAERHRAVLRPEAPSADMLRLVAIAVTAAIVKSVASIDRDANHLTVVAGKLIEELRVRGLIITEANRPGAG